MVQQLLRFRLYPATIHNPNTAATFHALHHFQLLSFESKCSVYEYYQTLVRETDNTGLHKVKVQYSSTFHSATILTECRIATRSYFV